MVIGIFLLGAACGSLLTAIRFRAELWRLKAQLEAQKQKRGSDEEAA